MVGKHGRHAAGGPKTSIFWSECCQEEALSTLVELGHRDLKAPPYSDRHTSSNKATSPLIKPHLLIVPLSVAKYFQTTTHTGYEVKFQKCVDIYVYVCMPKGMYVHRVNARAHRGQKSL